MRVRIPFPAIIAIYWGGFWFLNGLDAFFNSPDFFGYDHLSDMIEHFDLFGLPEGLARIALYLIAALEVVLGLSFLAALLNARYEASQQRNNFKIAAFIFIGLSFGDVLIGEHGTYRSSSGSTAPKVGASPGRKSAFYSSSSFAYWSLESSVARLLL